MDTYPAGEIDKRVKLLGISFIYRLVPTKACLTKAKMLYSIIYKVSMCAYLSLNDITILQC